MKIVLTQDVPKLGDMGTIQEVKSGFARNYLIPNGMAQIATPGVVKQVEERQEAERRRIAKLEEEMQELSDKIHGTRLEIHARVGEQGRLFGSITTSDIAERLGEAVESEIDRRNVELEQPIREVGEFTIPVRLIGRLRPEITVAVFDPTAPMIPTSFDEDSETEEVEAEEDIVTEVAAETPEAAAIPTAEPEDLDAAEEAEDSDEADEEDA